MAVSAETIEPPVEPLPAYPVSSVAAARLAADDPLYKGPARVESKEQWGRVLRRLRNGGEEACRHAGLPYVQVPEGVHDVTYGASPHGDLFFADLVASVRPLKEGERVLDFGCSTGRVIRNMAATLPIRAEGCDPRPSSIEFISGEVDNVDWFVSDETPPLPRPDDHYDVVFAVSVWSHFAEGAALAWFAEMARVVRPGGELLFSTHGERSVWFYETVKKTMPAAKARERREALAAGRLHFGRGRQKDLNADWGVAYIPRRWLEENLADDWRVRFFGSGMAKGNQDVYALQRT